MSYVVVTVSTEDMEGFDRMEVMGPFESEKEARKALRGSLPPFLRSTKRKLVKELACPPRAEDKVEGVTDQLGRHTNDDTVVAICDTCGAPHYHHDEVGGTCGFLVGDIYCSGTVVLK